MEQASIFGTLEPLSILFFIVVQIGGRYLKIDLTPAQQKLINNSMFQSIILLSIIYVSTKNFTNSIIIVMVIYICIYVLFNENHKYNILSKKWLYDEKIIETEYNNIKDIYIKNINNI
jgi:hypothetical protein